MRYTEYHCGVAVIKDKNLLNEAMGKLAAYEDADDAGKLVILPDREQLNKALAKLAKYEDAEQQGRLVELPCAIGEYVYRIVKTGASETYTIMHDGHEYSREVPFWGIWDCKFDLKLMDEFGKTVFLTQEAAQEALKKMEKAEGRR